MRAPRDWRWDRTAATVAVVALAMAGCSSPESGSPVSGGGVVGLRGSAPVALQMDQSCDEVLDDFKEIAPAVLEGQFGVAEGLETFGGAGEAVAEDSAATAPAAADLGSLGGGDGAARSSDTNTQEEGIDEPDVVETDGELVHLVDNDQLLVLDAATAAVLGRVQLAGHGAQIMRSGDRILAVIGGGYGIAAGGPAGAAVEDVASDPIPVEPVPVEPVPVDPVPIDPVPVDPVPIDPIPVEPPSFPTGTVLQLIDVSTPSAPAVLETTELEGQHVSTRVVDGVARVVITSYPQPEQLFAPIDTGGDVAEEIATNVEDTSVEDWLPAFRTTTRGTATSVEGVAVPCEQVLMPEVNAGLAETSVLRFDFQDGFDPAGTTTIVAEAGTVYASATTLYVAATRYVSPGVQSDIAAEDWSTAVHAFDLTGEGAARHAGAGEVPGSTLNQYSLSEHDGHLRIATTEGTPWGGGAESESAVRVLRLDGDQLVEVGAVGGLGRTETIQSVRFMGPVGYVVTFRQTDPLYVIDLSDPASPQAVGELKIPGFSSYLHPVGDGRLLGVGRDATLEGEDQGFLVSLFDVSDPTAPRQIQTFTQRDAHSNAGFDPKAFLWWAPESAAVVPYERYGPIQDERTGAQDVLTGMLVLDVDDGGITERAVVTADGRYPSRALVVQDRLWSLFDGGVVVSEFDSLTGGAFHPLR